MTTKKDLLTALDHDIAIFAELIEQSQHLELMIEKAQDDEKALLFDLDNPSEGTAERITEKLREIL